MRASRQQVASTAWTHAWQTPAQRAKERAAKEGPTGQSGASSGLRRPALALLSSGPGRLAGSPAGSAHRLPCWARQPAWLLRPARAVRPAADMGVSAEAVAEAYDAFERGEVASPLTAAAISNQTIQESMRLLLMVRAFQVMGHYAGGCARPPAAPAASCAAGMPRACASRVPPAAPACWACTMPVDCALRQQGADSAAWRRCASAACWRGARRPLHARAWLFPEPARVYTRRSVPHPPAVFPPPCRTRRLPLLPL